MGTNPETFVPDTPAAAPPPRVSAEPFGVRQLPRSKRSDSMRTRLFLICIVLLACSRGLVADEPDPWLAIRTGLEKYKSEGAAAAIQSWIKGTYLEGTKEAAAQANNLRSVEEYYGKYVTFHRVKRFVITPTSQICFLVMDYERGPLFAMFLVYKQKDSWLPVMFKFHTDCGQVWPSCTFASDRPADQ